MMAGPYRIAAAREVLRARTTGGVVRVEFAPRQTVIGAGSRSEVSITDRILRITQRGRRTKTRTVDLGRARLVVAHAYPTGSIALWHEYQVGRMHRIVGLSPSELLDSAALTALHQIERVGARLVEALAPHAHGVYRATEYGKGQHRVLELDFGDRLVLYARPVFRERPRRIIEVCEDGSIVVPNKKGPDRRVAVSNRYGVVHSGDRIRFCGAEGDDLASVFLPWIAPQDRVEITRRLCALIDRGAPAPSLGSDVSEANWLGAFYRAVPAR